MDFRKKGISTTVAAAIIIAIVAVGAASYVVLNPTKTVVTTTASTTQVVTSVSTSVSTSTSVTTSISTFSTTAISTVVAPKVLNVGLPDVPISLDVIQFEYTLTSEAAMALMYDGLFWLGPNGVTPQLVTTYSQNGSSWVFHLRQGVKFSDGTPLNASAVVADLQRQMVPTDPVTGKPTNTYSLYSIFTKVSALDLYTFKVDTAAPNPTVPALLAGAVGGGLNSPSAVKKFGSSYGTDPTKASGAGPYMAKSYTPGVELDLVRNPRYWGVPGSWDTIAFKQIADDSARLQALQAGTISIALAISPTVAYGVKNSTSLQVTTSDTIRPCFFRMNLRNGTQYPLSDGRVRLALNEAVNRTAITQDLLHGFYDTAYQPFAPGQVGYPNTGYVIPYNVTNAKALLAQAGYPNGFTIKAMISTWVPSITDVATAVQGYLAKIGVTLQIDNLPAGTYFSDQTNPSIMAGYALSSDCWGPLSGLSSEPLNGEFGTPASGGSWYNATLINVPALQTAINATLTAKTIAAYNQGMITAANIINTDSLVMPLFVQKTVTGMNANIRGIIINPQGVLFIYYGAGG